MFWSGAYDLHAQPAPPSSRVKEPIKLKASTFSSKTKEKAATSLHSLQILEATAVLLPEADSNALRKVEPNDAGSRPADVDADIRLETEIYLTAQLGKAYISNRTSLGAKFFLSFPDENMAAIRNDFSLRTPLFEHFHLLLRTTLKARGQKTAVRTYAWNQNELLLRSTAFSIPFLEDFGHSVVEAGISGAGFLSKQLPTASFMGSGLFTRLSFWPSQKEVFSLHIASNLNAYPTAPPLKLNDDANNDSINRAFSPLNAPPLWPFTCQRGATQNEEMRSDFPFNANMSFTSSRKVFFSARYSFKRNSSNSCGESFTRHQVSILFGFSLPAKVVFSLDAALQKTTYDDGVGLGQQIILQRDDENQNRVVLRLKRPVFEALLTQLGWRIFLEARAAYFSSEFSDSRRINLEPAAARPLFSRLVFSVGLGGGIFRVP